MLEFFNFIVKSSDFVTDFTLDRAFPLTHKGPEYMINSYLIKWPVRIITEISNGHTFDFLPRF